jgi:16S rRNA (cytidine1402-2'-O)-methyltransferase
VIDEAQSVAPGTLAVCATPIGNLADVSMRLRAVLADVDLIACEDTRRCRSLLSALKIIAPRIVACHDHNEAVAAQAIVDVLATGGSAAYVSDAGTPGIADPGAVLVKLVRDAGFEVVAVPGPSAVAAAISVAGIPNARHTFVSFLPRSDGDLLALIRDTAHDVVVAFESPARIAHSLATIAGEQPERHVVMSRELTKFHEQTIEGTAAELAARTANSLTRGEIVLVLDALPRTQANVDANLVELVIALEQDGIRKKDASKHVARFAGVSARDLYDAVVAAAERRA